MRIYMVVKEDVWDEYYEQKCHKIFKSRKLATTYINKQEDKYLYDVDVWEVE